MKKIFWQGPEHSYFPIVNNINSDPYKFEGQDDKSTVGQTGAAEKAAIAAFNAARPGQVAADAFAAEIRSLGPDARFEIRDTGTDDYTEFTLDIFQGRFDPGVPFALTTGDIWDAKELAEKFRSVGIPATEILKLVHCNQAWTRV